MAANSSSRDEPKIEPIYDEVCEQAVIGCLLLDRDSIALVSRILSVDDFYLAFHRFVYQIMLDMWSRREPCDLVTFSSEFWRRIKAMDEGDIAALNMPLVPESYVAECTQIATTAVHAEFYARRVLDFADRYRLATASLRGIEGAYRIDSDMDTVVEETVAGARESRRMPPAGRYLAIGDIPEEVNVPRVKIGGSFHELDGLTGGFEPGQMIVVAARPSVGKSAIVLQWLYTFVGRTFTPAGIISLEMHRRDVMERLLGMASGVNMHALRSGLTATKDEYQRLSEARGMLATLPLFVDDDPDTTLTAVVSRAKAMAMEQKIGLLGIDYLQLMQVGGKQDNRVQEVSRISAAMKQLARELSIPVIVLAQLNRGVEFRPDAEPKISDLRDSGAIEQDADIVCLLHRVNDEGAVKVIVGKNRNGPVGWVDMTFNKRTASFKAMGEAA